MSATDLDLTRLEELAEKATPGPWHSCADDGIGTTEHTVVEDVDGKGVAYDCLTTGDAEFIAEFRNAVPSLLAAARANIEVRRMAESLRDDAESQQNRVVGRALLAALGGAE